MRKQQKQKAILFLLSKHCPKNTWSFTLTKCNSGTQVPLNFRSINYFLKSYPWTWITSSTCVVKLKGKKKLWPSQVPCAVENSGCRLCPALSKAGALLSQQEQACSHQNKTGVVALYGKSAHTATALSRNATEPRAFVRTYFQHFFTLKELEETFP